MIDPPPAGRARFDGPDWARSWADAVAGLADLDEDGVIVAANAEFRAMTGLSVDDLVGTVRWIEVLSVGSRVYYDTQIATVLHLQSSVSEVMLDVLAPDGTRLPALFSARSLRDESGRIYGTRIALTAARDRQRFETALLEARGAAELAGSRSDTCRPRTRSRSAATGTTPTFVRTESSLWRSATWPGMTSRPRQRWGSCAGSSARSGTRPANAQRHPEPSRRRGSRPA